MRANQPSGEVTIIDGVPLAGGVVVVSTASVAVFPAYLGSDAAHNISCITWYLRTNRSASCTTGWAPTSFPIHRIPPGCANEGRNLRFDPQDAINSAGKVRSGGFEALAGIQCREPGQAKEYAGYDSTSSLIDSQMDGEYTFCTVLVRVQRCLQLEKASAWLLSYTQRRKICERCEQSLQP